MVLMHRATARLTVSFPPCAQMDKLERLEKRMEALLNRMPTAEALMSGGLSARKASRSSPAATPGDGDGASSLLSPRGRKNSNTNSSPLPVEGGGRLLRRPPPSWGASSAGRRASGGPMW
jgi:hypothetical protein